VRRVRRAVEEIEPIVISTGVVAGGLGVAVSVMSRIADGDLRAGPAAPSSITRLAGVLRVLIGAVFGMVSSVVIVSGVCRWTRTRAATPPFLQGSPS
jgi:hypothetical protein